MLFQNSVPQLFQKLNIQADSAESLARKEDTAKRLNFYHDKQIERLENQLSQLFSDPSNMVKVELNIVKKIIRALCQLYRVAAKREIEGSQKDKDVFQAISEMSALDVKLKQAHRYTKLLKTILLRPIWRNGKLDIDILTGNILDVDTGDSPEELTKVLITDYGNSNKIEEVEYSLWTPEEYQRLDYQGYVIDEQENPYGVLPFLPVWDYPPTGSEFWLSGGDDLISLQEMINLKLTDLCYLIRQQSFGVGWIKSGKGGGSVQADPGTLVELPLDKDSGIGFESQQSEIGQVVEAIDRLIKWAAMSNGLSVSTVDTKSTREFSGVAKLVDTQELLELREDDKTVWRAYEKQLFNLIRVVWNTHNQKDKISRESTLTVDFSDPRPIISPKDQAVAWESQLSMGVISPVDIVLERNPDLGTRENALAHLLQIQEEQRQLAELADRLLK